LYGIHKHPAGYTIHVAGKVEAGNKHVAFSLQAQKEHVPGNIPNVESLQTSVDRSSAMAGERYWNISVLLSNVPCKMCWQYMHVGNSMQLSLLLSSRI